MKVQRFFRRWWNANLRHFDQSRRMRMQSRLPAPPVPEPERWLEVVKHEANCGFVLSTGRCGTTLLTKILSLNYCIEAVHEPQPNLQWPAKRAYELGADDTLLLREIALHLRIDAIGTAWQRGLIYVETHNRITFYAAALAREFARAKFVHLIRNPHAFIASGLRRGYYTGSRLDYGRIMPRAGSEAAALWPTWTQAEKIAWLWTETNRVAEHVRTLAGTERFRVVKAEELFSSTATGCDITKWLGAEVPESSVAKLLQKPINAQSNGNSLELVRMWSVKERERIDAIVAPVAQAYGYL